MSKITDLYTQLLHQARVSGRDQHKLLAGGARLSVGVDDTQITLAIARTPQRVGDREIVVFRADCCVPSEALRWPDEGQRQIEREGKHWWVVAFRWCVVPEVTEEAPLFVEEPAL